jgi:nucleoid-associated protein YgaU
MSDVEKYGLFALLFVVVVLALILASGGGGEAQAAADPLRPVVIRTPAQVPPPAPRASRNGPAPRAARNDGPVKTYRVEPLAADRGPFRPDEPPVVYPGARSTAVPTNAAGQVLHTVAPNETLTDISRIYYGTTTRWRDIAALNPGLDPKKLQVGQTIIVQRRLPSGKRASAPATTPQVASAAPQKPADKPSEYVVQKGDTLGEIAQRTLGSARRADELFKANKAVLKSPDALMPGMRLRIP